MPKDYPLSGNPSLGGVVSFLRNSQQSQPLIYRSDNYILQRNKHYLQITFNYDLYSVHSILPRIPFDERIIIEAGTPFIKKEGMAGVRAISSIWPGKVVADMKVSDGALGEVEMARAAGATAITAAGQAPKETLDLFIASCKTNKLISMIDMIGVDDPLKVIRQLKSQPNVVILHKGRDEETTRGKVIEYRHVKRIKYKYDIIISAAGGVNAKEARSAVFNGANIIVANLVQSGDPWEGIPTNSNIAQLANQFLTNIE